MFTAALQSWQPARNCFGLVVGAANRQPGFSSTSVRRHPWLIPACQADGLPRIGKAHATAVASRRGCLTDDYLTQPDLRRIGVGPSAGPVNLCSPGSDPV